MRSTNLFRLLVASEWLVVASGVVASLAFQPSLPAPLRRFLNSEENDPYLGELPVVLYLGFALLLAWVASSIGLFFFRAWAPRVYLATTLAGLVLAGFGGPNVTPGPAEPFFQATMLVSGVILGWLFFAGKTLPFSREQS